MNIIALKHVSLSFHDPGSEDVNHIIGIVNHIPVQNTGICLRSGETYYQYNDLGKKKQLSKKNKITLHLLILIFLINSLLINHFKLE